MTAEREMPQYKCHKVVSALTIDLVVPSKAGDVCTLGFLENGYEPILVEFSWFEKHMPQVGGYYVFYEDGYKSFSPAEAFEKGYTRIDGREAAPQRSFLDCDDSGHWYLIPCERVSEWDAFCEHKEGDEDFDEMAFDSCRIAGSPRWVTFTNPVDTAS